MQSPNSAFLSRADRQKSARRLLAERGVFPSNASNYGLMAGLLFMIAMVLGRELAGTSIWVSLGVMAAGMSIFAAAGILADKHYENQVDAVADDPELRAHMERSSKDESDQS